MVSDTSKRSTEEVMRLFEGYQPLVHKVVSAFAQRAGIIDRDDMFAVGQLGLYKAALEYDSSHNCSFGTYAANRIRWMILGEIKEVAPLPVKTYRKRMVLGEGIPDHISLEELQDWGCPSVESCQSEVEFDELAGDLNAHINKLPARYQKIIRDRFYGEKTFEQIAAEFGVRRQAVQQIETRAISKLRKSIEGKDPCHAP